MKAQIKLGRIFGVKIGLHYSWLIIALLVSTSPASRAVVGNPEIVLFDEPTAALDPPTAATISALIIRLRDLENVTSILVTHEMDTVKYITSAYAVVSEKGEVTVEEEGDNFCLSNTKILMLREGRVIFNGTNEEFVRSEDPYIQKFISGTEMEPNQMTQ